MSSTVVICLTLLVCPCPWPASCDAESLPVDTPPQSLAIFFAHLVCDAESVPVDKTPRLHTSGRGDAASPEPRGDASELVDAVDNSPRPYETPRRPASDDGLKKEQNNRPLHEGADDPRAVFDCSCGVRGGRGWTLLVDR